MYGLIPIRNINIDFQICLDSDGTLTSREKERGMIMGEYETSFEASYMPPVNGSWLTSPLINATTPYTKSHNASVIRLPSLWSKSIGSHVA